MAGKLKVSPALKKLIIGMVAFVVLGIVAILAFSVFSGITQTTIYDLRIVYADTLSQKNPTEVFDKQVYLTKEDENYFNVAIKSSASNALACSLISTNTDVATVSFENNSFKISYFGVGKTDIIARPVESGDIYDKFTLTVCQNIPTEFEFSDEIEDVVSGQEINVYADEIEHSYDFTATLYQTTQKVNLDSLSLVEDYDSELFKYIRIDTGSKGEEMAENTARLVIKAKRSTDVSSSHYLKILAKNGDSSVTTFIIKVNVLGNYINTFKLEISDTPYFINSTILESKYKASDGYYNDDKKLMDEQLPVYISKDLNSFYELFIKVYVVYNNGREELVADDDSSRSLTVGAKNGGEVSKIDSSYFSFRPTSENVALELNINIDNVALKRTFKFSYGPELTDLYERKIIEVDGSEKVYYQYKYFDSRFKWDNVVTDKDGKVIKFLQNNGTEESPEWEDVTPLDDEWESAIGA